MLNHVLKTYALNLMVAELLVDDITPEQMCQQPNGLINHPAWSLGHLITSSREAGKLIGAEADLPASWAQKFKAGTPPDPDTAANPSKEELLSELKKIHERLSETLPGVDAAKLEEQHPVEEVRKYFPTVGDQVVYSMTAHEMDHLGQVAAWRRAMGLPPKL